MKKKIIGVFGVIAALMSMFVLVTTGCNGGAVATSEDESYWGLSVDDTQPVILEEVSEEPPVEPEVVSEVPEVVSEEPVEEDPLGVLLLDEDDEKGICLLRDGKYYMISDWLPLFNREKMEKYGDIGATSPNCRLIYVYDKPDNSLISIGEVPIPRIQDGDILMAYGETKISLQRVIFYGYCVPVREDHKTLYLYDHSDAGIRVIYSSDFDKYGVMDENGNDVDDCYNLEKGKEYTVYWFNSKNDNELKMIADSSMYTVERDLAYTISPEPMDKKYSKYDLSGVAPGIYLLNGALIEVE